MNQPDPTTNRRDRYATAIRKWHRDPEQPLYTEGADAMMAVADTEQAELRAETEAYRLALSQSLGLGTGANWEALRDRARDLAAEAEELTAATRRLGLTVSEYGQGASALGDKLRRARELHRETCPLATGKVAAGFSCSMCELLDAPAAPVVPPAPTSRAAMLREAIDVAREEGHRLEAEQGIEAARGARSVAYLLRKLLAKADTPVDWAAVAYRSPGTRTLYCVICARQETGWQPVTADALPDVGTVCDFCGGRVLAVASRTLGDVVARYMPVAEMPTDRVAVPAAAEEQPGAVIPGVLEKPDGEFKETASALNSAAEEQPESETPDSDRVVAHVLAVHTALLCLACAPSPWGDIWTPVTAGELENGGICSKCGADVLIPLPSKEA